jgi:hypothetical protein
MVSNHHTTQRSNPENHGLYLRSESLKSSIDSENSKENIKNYYLNILSLSSFQTEISHTNQLYNNISQMAMVQSF